MWQRIKKEMKAGASDLSAVLFSPTCHVCGSPLGSHEKQICSLCLQNLPRTLSHRTDMNIMSERFAGIIPFVRASGHFHYSRQSVVATLIQDFKYRRYPSLAQRLGEVMGEELMASGYFSDVDVLMPIPIYILKRAKRGYNQTEQIARGMSRICGVPVDCSLRATRPHATQTSLSGAARAANTIGIFSLRHPERLASKHIMLIDDVCTTGATLRSAAIEILGSFPHEEFRPRLSMLTLCVAR
ncbi:MAG: ComF family protein [Muribaculum sp.]|nr:ComF family protein [Muribaculum sp.]